jgi:hypothetical protein
MGPGAVKKVLMTLVLQDGEFPMAEKQDFGIRHWELRIVIVEVMIQKIGV